MRTSFTAVALLALLASASEAQRRECTRLEYLQNRCPKESQTPVPSAEAQVPAPKASVPVQPAPVVSTDSQPADTKVAVVTGPEFKPSGLSTRRLSLVARDDRFATSEACLNALKAGTARFYHPTYFKPVRLGSGERTLELEHDACVRMQIVGAIAWVPQARGTKLDFNGTTPVRRTDCGNKVYAVVYPTVPAEPPSESLAPPSFTPDTVYREVQVPIVPTVNVTVKRRNPWPWVVGGLVAGAAVCEAASRRFDHKPWAFRCFEKRTEVEIEQIQMFISSAFRH